MKTAHSGMKISNDDWLNFIDHFNATMKDMNIPEAESSQVIDFVQSLKSQIVEMSTQALYQVTSNSHI